MTVVARANKQIIEQISARITLSSQTEHFCIPLVLRAMQDLRNYDSNFELQKKHAIAVSKALRIIATSNQGNSIQHKWMETVMSWLYYGYKNTQQRIPPEVRINLIATANTLRKKKNSLINKKLCKNIIDDLQQQNTSKTKTMVEPLMKIRHINEA